jgi:hypothetical protein
MVFAVFIVLAGFLETALAKEVKIFDCSPSHTIAVQSGTPGAPVLPALSCAEAIQILFEAGFKLRFVTSRPRGDLVANVVYTFEK